MGYKERVDELREEMISSLIDIVKIPSIKAQGTKDYPFGENIDKALRKTLDICKSLGFRTFYGQGYYGYAEIGEGEEMLGILGHLDVVPEGEQESWNFEPFSGEIHNNRVYGRGTQDDKGPVIAAIYAVKALMDSGIKLSKRVRFIFGTDEENLWEGIKKYMEQEENPTIGFTPDSDFPMIFAEKGLLQVKLKSYDKCEIQLKGGNAFNAIPDKVAYNDEGVHEVSKELTRLGFEYREKDNTITVLGKGAHAAKPQHGINPISRLSIALNKLDFKSKTVKFIAEAIGEDYNGERIFGNCEDEPSGKLTLNVGKIELNDEIEEISIDIRIPVTIDKATIVAALKAKAEEYGLEYEEYDYLDSLYVPKDHFLIKTLRKVFEEETGLSSEPISTGGATYARAMDNCVAFGPIFPGQEKVEHQANEYVDIERLIMTSKIYASAVHELTK